MIDRDELGAWLRLLGAPGLGRESIRRLLAAFGSPDRVLRAAPGAWAQVVGSHKAAALARAPASWAAQVEATLTWLGTQENEPRHLIPLGDPHYPALLLEAPDPPLFLYAIGRSDLLCAEALAIVGSRSPSAQGSANAQAFAQHLSRAGVTVVSGLALGIDAAAHAGGLGGVGGTIAVVGTGLDSVYPRRNRDLAARIARGGLILSEYALGTPPLPANFPRRNRIIAGLARGTLVVEAALRSGSLITARLANEAGREVFAIPGSILSPHARGCHALIKDGAQLVESAEEILESLGRPWRPSTGESRAPAAADPDQALLEALGHDPVTLDALAARTGRSAADLNIRLLNLELEGRLARLPGQLFQYVGYTEPDPAGV